MNLGKIQRMTHGIPSQNMEAMRPGRRYCKDGDSIDSEPAKAKDLCQLNAHGNVKLVRTGEIVRVRRWQRL